MGRGSINGPYGSPPPVPVENSKYSSYKPLPATSIYSMIKNKKILPTKFDGYYVSEDGKIFTEWHLVNNNGRFGSIRGELREVKSHPRGGCNPNDRYLAVNISLKNDQGKTIKQIKYYSHRLIAETFIENPQNLKEVDHIDGNKQNNSTTNLRWVDRKENLKWMIGNTFGKNFRQKKSENLVDSRRKK